MKSWAYKRAIYGLLTIAEEATQAAFAIVDEEDCELANLLDEARFAVSKAAKVAASDTYEGSLSSSDAHDTDEKGTKSQ